MRASGPSACSKAKSCAGTKGSVNVSRLLSLLTIGASLFARVLSADVIPDEDQGIFGINLQQLPPRASLERKSVVLKKVEDIITKTDGLDSCQTVCGYGVVTSTPTRRTTPRSSCA
jgi:multidrug efflux pump subunit AcrB